MDGRISAWFLAIPLTALCVGCVSTQSQKDKAVATPPATTNVTRMDEAPRPKKDDAPKRNPHPSTEIVFGKMKEAEADSEAGKASPEIQARLRDEARQAYQHALQIDPNNLDAFRHLAKLYAKMNDFERANDVYRKAMTKYPKNAALWYDLGLCHNRRKDFADGVRCLNKALEFEPENRDYLKKLGFTLAWIGQVDQGLACLTRAQGAALAHFELACMFDQKEQRAQAIHHLKLARRENGELLDEARELLEALDSPGVTRPALRAALQAPISDG
jgi:tetratricopeptide (TPR) repeat protein